MKRTFQTALVALLAVGLAACGTDDAEMTGTPAPVESAESVNMLTDAERAEGWQLLFDGQSADGWRAFGGDAMPAQWTIADGALHFDPSVEGEGGDIITDETYDNFEFVFDWKIGECGNSGVFYHVTESEEFTGVPQTGPEYQILDNTCHPDAENGPDRHAGANYALNAPSTDVTKPAGEWNTSRIVINGPMVEHWLNGEKVVEYELWSDAWKESVAASKFGQWADYGMARTGHIALQDHNDPVWYRNLKIRPLEPTAES